MWALNVNSILKMPFVLYNMFSGGHFEVIDYLTRRRAIKTKIILICLMQLFENSLVYKLSYF